MDPTNPHELPALPIEYAYKTKRPILSVCMCVLEERQMRAAALIYKIAKQARASGDVEVLTCVDNREVPSGWKRHLLSVASAGDYISFVDDDDDISADYVERIVRACDREPDVVTLNAMYVEGSSQEENRFRLAGPDHVRDYERGHMKMTANHLCAWRRELQRKVAFPPFLGYNDDCLWYEPLVKTGWAKSEFRINRALYIYKFSRQYSVNQSPPLVEKAFQIIQEGLECFTQGREIFIATRPVNQVGTDPIIDCRNCDNVIVKKARADMEHYFTFQVH